MSTDSQAIFLSYASEDAESVRRIAEALRAAGLEVWFDENELHGGDAWDQKIRRQIKECALFMPVISAHTQTRLEGYFRREWRMAVDRMHDMDDTLPFLVPVVLDDTSDAAARVPERFKERQWTRLPGGETSNDFVDRVAGLLAGRSEPWPAAGRTGGSNARPIPAARTRGYPQWLTAFFILVGVSTGIFYSVVRPMLDRDTESPASAPAAAITEERPYFIGSVAVLPLQVLANSADAPALADGLQDEMLTQLSRMRPLDAASRTSTLQYRDHTTSVREIGRALNADFVVEGSLQLEGSRWRVTLQLIEAATDRHLWANTFDRVPDPEVTGLAFQKDLAWELAISVYRALRRERPPSPESRERFDAVVGRLSAEAKELELRFWGDAATPRDYSVYDALLELERRIIAIDPDNAAAHTSLSGFLGQAPYAGKASFFDRVWSEELMLALHRAVFVNPEHFDTQRNLGTYYLMNRADPARALPHLRKAVRLFEAEPAQPNNWSHCLLSRALWMTGQSPAALRVLERAPQPPEPAQFSYWLYAFRDTRRFADALAFLDEHRGLVAAASDGRLVLELEVQRAEILTEWTGSREPSRELLEQIRGNPHATPGLRARLRYDIGDFSGALEEFAAIDPGNDSFAYESLDLLIYRGFALAKTGSTALAESLFRSALTELESGRQSADYLRLSPGRTYSGIAIIHALLGNAAAMQDAIARAEAGIDAARNYQEYLGVQGLIAAAYSRVGDVPAACARIELMLSSPTGISVGRYLSDSFFDPLHASPEFQAVMRKHANQLKDPAMLDTYFQSAAP